ncbi:MAG: prolyl oligopeptidase family serine peptidase [Verrucomicrobiales bacterium]|nr:prolyl oligopeptidase family serine peptidase [Verrucomicrobiales bacterium]
MKPLSLLAIACAFAFTLRVSHGQDIMPKNQQTKSFRGKLTRSVQAKYLLFLPREYKQSGTKRWPMILFLHGAGERGTNINHVAVHGPPKIVKDRPEFPFIVVSPQCPNDQAWSQDALLLLVDEIVRKYKVDQSRVYLTGLSMGGYGAWQLGLNHPERFAAIAPICGGGDILPILLTERKQAKRLKELPIWAFHGAKDQLVKLAESERMIEALRKIGNEAKLTVYADAEHDAWTETYNNPALYDWFLQHQNRHLLPNGRPRKP